MAPTLVQGLGTDPGASRSPDDLARLHWSDGPVLPVAVASGRVHDPGERAAVSLDGAAGDRDKGYTIID